MVAQHPGNISDEATTHSGNIFNEAMRQEFLRPHGRPGNLQQHQAFLSEVEGTPEYEDVIARFKTLPLWLDLGGLRVVHACWHQASIDLLRKAMGSGQKLMDEMILLGSRKGDPIYKAIETICKGPEVDLPAGISFKDKEGKVRTEVRVKWWQPEARTFREAAIGPGDEIKNIPDVPLLVGWQFGAALPQDVATAGGREASRPRAADSPSPGEGRKPERPGQTENNMAMIPDLPMPTEWVGHPYVGPPVLFGHYWSTGEPEVISKRFACVAYSVANGGPLVAYRWDGEEELRTEKMVWV